MTPASFVRDLLAFSMQLAVVAISMAVLLKIVHVPARSRYMSLRLALGLCLVTPWVLRTPELSQPTSAVSHAVFAAIQPVAMLPEQDGVAQEVDGAAAPPVLSAAAMDWAEMLLGALVFGAVVRALWLVVGLVRLRRLNIRAVAIDLPEDAALQRRIGTRATIAEVAGLAQPATFGLRRPVVLLPQTLAHAPPALRRAVVAHELIHVRRGDWLAVLGEEALRSVLWFHPAIVWLTSAIQAAREEIVDDLTVRTTGDRRSYMQALLAFADGPALRPAPSFAHRRRLFRRIVAISKENVMSMPRLVASLGVLVAGVLTASWYASSVFPIVTTVSAEAAPTVPTASSLLPSVEGAQQIVLTEGDLHAAAPAIDAADSRQRTVSAPTQSAPRPVTPENPIPVRTRGVSPVWPFAFAGERVQVAVNALVTVDSEGAVTNVERLGCAVSERGNLFVPANDGSVCGAFFDATADALRQWHYERPVLGAVQFYVIMSFRPGMEPAITHSGTPLRLTSAGPTLIPELTWPVRGPVEQSLRVQQIELSAVLRELMRIRSQMTPGSPDTLRLQQEIARIDEELSRVEQALRDAAAAREAVPKPAQPAPVAPPQGARLVAPSGRAPLRVGGSVEAPRPLVQPQPVYSQEAMAARVEGEVVLEVVVDEDGRVPDARIVKSIPLLDQSAIDAVKQWRFVPARLNGEPVPVIVQVHFALRR